jgi:ssDNA-binding Zn-finger/Zn-ribbon topoisomerase 1
MKLNGDFKNFRHFQRTHKRLAEKCPNCDEEFSVVQLTLSNKKELFVRCATDGCTGSTIAKER